MVQFASYLRRVLFFLYKWPYCLTAALKFHVFLPTTFVSFVFNHSVIHVSVNIKNNVEKDETLLLFFLSKSPGGHSISFQIKPRVAFRLPYLLYPCAADGLSGVRPVGWSAGVRSRDYQIFSDG